MRDCRRRFFESVPNGDAYLLKFIIHDWNDEQCRTILRNCREAISGNGKILAIENVLNHAISLAPEN